MQSPQSKHKTRTMSTRNYLRQKYLVSVYRITSRQDKAMKEVEVWKPPKQPRCVCFTFKYFSLRQGQHHVNFKTIWIYEQDCFHFPSFRFKSNYLDMYRDRTGRYLDGFHQFMSEGVRTRYLKSVFPAESFPAWQTIQTGKMNMDLTLYTRQL